MTTLVTLVGEQPIPNLLPIRALRPEQTLFIHTGRGPRGTQGVAERISRLVEQETQPDFLLVQPYDLLETRQAIADQLGAEPAIFNLTGGTKIMALAAYALAVERNAPFVYFQTEGPRGRDQRAALYRYGFDQRRPVLQERRVLNQPLISLDDYLLAHLPAFEETGFAKDDDGKLNSGGRFEQAVARALDGWVDELKAGVRPKGIKDQLEIDLVIRCGNQVGIIEAKLGGQGSGKHAVDQLTTAAAREYLGTYTARFLVTGGERDKRYAALAQEVDVHTITLPGYRNGRLSQQDVRNLRQRIGQHLPGKSISKRL
ncbi:MAG: DUF1887 family CARF protein [Chloroflexota bacterium]|nr:DUF1887 family CARF protein [Chloroflexota bacterium]